MKWMRLAIGSVVLVGTAVFVAVQFGSYEVRQLQQEVSRLEQERQQLLTYARRLCASRRVAQVDVVRQREDRDGRTISTLLWQEIGADGTLGKPLALETIGRQVYFEALVIKFDPELVKEGDAERGTSLAMFRRIFGDRQAPESVDDIDRSARPPVLTGDAPALHDELWERFWELIDDPELAAKFGVRIAQCEAPSVLLKPNQIWEVTLDAAGGLNLRRIGTRESDDGHVSAWPESRTSP
ncbi:MAG: hypothetical protein PVJ57_07905 [Phycisphaerae bacterium]|jgi:hypothetical protein